MVQAFRPVVGSNRITALSSAQLARSWPMGEKATLSTAPCQRVQLLARAGVPKDHSAAPAPAGDAPAIRRDGLVWPPTRSLSSTCPATTPRSRKKWPNIPALGSASPFMYESMAARAADAVFHGHRWPCARQGIAPPATLACGRRRAQVRPCRRCQWLAEDLGGGCTWREAMDGKGLAAGSADVGKRPSGRPFITSSLHCTCAHLIRHPQQHSHM